MKRIIKIILIGLISVTILFFGLAYYAYKKISPEEIKRSVIANLDSRFQNAKTQLGEVTLKFGLVFEVGFNGLKLENEKADLLTIEEFKGRIPFYSILFGAGAVDIFLKDMKINYLETPTGTNWNMKKGQSSEGGGNYSFLLANVKINVKINNLKVFYALKTGKNGEVDFQEADFFNLNFLSKTKYSAKSLIKGKDYSFLADGGGDIDLSKYWNEKLITGTSSLIFSDFKTKMIPGKIPNLKTEISFSYDSSGKLKSDIQSFIGREKVFDSKLSYYQGVSVYDPMKLTIPLEKVLSEYGPLSFKDNELNISGKFTMTEQEIIPDLTFNWDKGPILKEYKAPTKLKGKLKNNFLEMDISTNILEGSAKIGLSGKINYTDPKKLGPFKMDIVLKDLKIKAPPPEKTPPAGGSVPKKSSKAMALVPANINLTMENITIMDTKMSGNGTIILGENYLKIPKLNILVGGGKGSLSTQVSFERDKKVGDFNAGFDGIDLKVFNPYFPKGVGVITGTIFGKFNGNFEQGEKGVVVTNGKFDLLARDGKIKEFNMEKHILKIFNLVPLLSEAKKEDIGSWVTGDFQSVEINGKMDHEQIVLDKMHFLGINKNIEIKGKGEINKTKNSQVLFDFIDHKGTISGPIKKYTGTDILKFKFQGIGYDLKPDYGYTANFLGKGAINTGLEQMGKKFLDKFFKK